jgi:hypothetical protein
VFSPDTSAFPSSLPSHPLPPTREEQEAQQRAAQAAYILGDKALERAKRRQAQPPARPAVAQPDVARWQFWTGLIVAGLCGGIFWAFPEARALTKDVVLTVLIVALAWALATCPYIKWRFARIGFAIVVALVACPVAYLKIAASSPQVLPAAAPAQAPIYGYLALRCTFGRHGTADVDYTLYQHPENLQPPMFVGLPPSFDATIQLQSMETCVLNNDGPEPVYNLHLAFAYKLVTPAKREQFSDSELTPSDIYISRIPAHSPYTFRILDDLPGLDLGLAPTGECSMDTPGHPDTREKCVLPKDPNTPPYVLQFPALLFHYRSLTDCHGFVPPLAKNQQECSGHKKAR